MLKYVVYLQADSLKCLLIIHISRDPSVETIVAHLSGGVNQAPNLVLDVTGKVNILMLFMENEKKHIEVSIFGTFV